MNKKRVSRTQKKYRKSYKNRTKYNRTKQNRAKQNRSRNIQSTYRGGNKILVNKINDLIKEGIKKFGDHFNGLDFKMIKSEANKLNDMRKVMSKEDLHQAAGVKICSLIKYTMKPIFYLNDENCIAIVTKYMNLSLFDLLKEAKNMIKSKINFSSVIKQKGGDFGVGAGIAVA